MSEDNSQQRSQQSAQLKTPEQSQRQVQEQSHRPRKRFGQNFLQDPSIIERIVDAIAPERNPRLVEIGPGQGAITNRILARISEEQNLVVVELDRDLAAVFEEKAQMLPNLDVIQADVLKVDLITLLGSESQQGVKLFGNLPYNISTPLLIKLVEAHMSASRVANPLCADMVFMLQKEVVDRIVAEPGNKTYGRLSVVLQSAFEVEPLFDVPPKAFFPAPKVMSSIVRLVPRSSTLVAPESFVDFQKLVATAFSQRRKTLKNTLKSLVDEEGFNQACIQSNLRAEVLSVEDFVRLTSVMKKV